MRSPEARHPARRLQKKRGAALRFTILPAIDLMGGKAVCLERGNPQTKKFEGEPLKIAEGHIAAGARWLHVVDLDAALSTGSNAEKINEIIGLGCKTEVGGGIRSIERAESLIAAGAERIVMGTKAFDAGFMEEMKKKAGKKRIVVALDSMDEKIVVKGWRENTGKSLYEAAASLEKYAGHFLFTPVEIEGMLQGPRTGQLEKLYKATNVPIIYSGGISSLQDVKDIKNAGAKGCIIGLALYEKRFALGDALGMEGG